MVNICRICMISVKNLVCLVEEAVDGKFTISTNGKYFEEYLGIKLEELPDFRKICTKCNSQLHNFHAFKIQAVEHHEKLLTLYHDTQFKKERKDTTIVKGKTSNQYTTKTKRDGSSRITKIQRKNTSNSDTTKNLYSEDNCSENGDKILVRNLSEASESITISENRIESNLNPNEDENFNLNSNLLEMKIEVQDVDFINIDNSESLSEDNKDTNDSLVSSQEDVENEEELKLKSRKAGGSSFWRYPCTKCNRKFHAEASYDAHQNVHKGLPPYSCKQCGKSFTSKASIDYHMNNHNNVRPFTCDICGKSYLSNGDLRKHKKFHDDTEFLVCHICGIKCKTKNNLERHFETHATTKKYECSICFNKCKTKCTLKEHIDTVHLRNKQYICPVCGKVFYRNKLKKHLKVHQKHKGKQ